MPLVFYYCAGERWAPHLLYASPQRIANATEHEDLGAFHVNLYGNMHTCWREGYGAFIQRRRECGLYLQQVNGAFRELSLGGCKATGGESHSMNARCLSYGA